MARHEIGQRATTWRCGNYAFSLAHPLIMGVLNVTPDSFSDGGAYPTTEAAIEAAWKMVEQGANIIDVGGESTRPGAEPVDVDVELSRTVQVVQELARHTICVSIDTRHPEVAAACVDAGASIVNDVSGFTDPLMRTVVSNTTAGCIIMHMSGDPMTMQDGPWYDDVTGEVEGFLLKQADMLEAADVSSDRICLDPGIGFGKTKEHNIALLEATERFADHGYPLMVAVSRKSIVGDLYGGEDPAQRTWGSVALAVEAISKGARIARVHDVAQAARALQALQLPAHRAMIALGSNMGDRAAAIRAAIDLIGALPYTQVYAKSRIYESEPAYLTNQPPFANSVIETQTQLIPEVLLAELQRIERTAGRVRTVANGPRPLDLDILDYSGVTMQTDSLTLPHPKMGERDFVVTPLLEIAPGFKGSDDVYIGRSTIICGKVMGTLS